MILGGCVICSDKDKLDIKETKKKINKCLKVNYYYASREWPYKNIKPRIIIEKLLKAEELTEYKFFCFNGEPKYVFIAKGKAHSEQRKASFYEINLCKAPFGRTDVQDISDDIEKPKNYEKMVEISRRLSEKNIFLRVDFYNINGKIYCGELTFYPCSGYLPFTPIEWDKKLGDILNLAKEGLKDKNEK